MSRLDPVDVVVVGSGMAGGALTTVLAEGGVRVVCLEQGDWIAPEDRPHSDPYWELRRAENWSTAPNVRRWDSDYPIDTDRIQPLMLNAVGGSTAVYTAAWPRFRPSDFRKGTEHGLAPDWPLTYEDLAPCYELNDRAMGVSGIHGDRAYPPRGARPTRQLPLGRRSEVAIAGFERLGWHWWPFDMAVISEPYAGRLPCNHCGACQSGCPRESLATTANTYLPRAIRAGADLRTGARVEEIPTDAVGRAVGAVYVDRRTGERLFQPAEVVVVACNGIGTPRLLLNSTSKAHPNGLANGSDQVGRNLMFHALAIVEIWTETVLEPHKGVICASVYSCEFAETDVSRGLVNGATLLVCGMNGPGYQAIGSHSGNVAPWGTAHHAWFQEHFGRGFCILVQGEDLPAPHNRITLSSTLVDADGIPAPRLEYTLHRNDRKLLDFAIARSLELAQAVGATDVRVNDFTAPDGSYAPPAWHLMGTARMGTDPETSVTDPWHRAWDCDNLVVCDGSSLPTGGAVNPTSTIGALAVRCGQHLLELARGGSMRRAA